MLKIYTSYNCSSCKTAIKWFKDHGIVHEEYNFFSRDLTEQEVLEMLKYTDEGFEEIVSERSKIYNKYKEQISDMTTKELINFIVENPSVLKRPIVVDDVTKEIKTGFNEGEYNDFI